MEDSEGLSQFEFLALTQVLIAGRILPGVDAELVGPVDHEEGAGQFADAAGGPVAEQHRDEVGRGADDQVRVEQDDEEGGADDGLVGSLGVFGVVLWNPGVSTSSQSPQRKTSAVAVFGWAATSSWSGTSRSESTSSRLMNDDLPVL